MTHEDVARWMLSQYEEHGFLYQETVATHLFQLRDPELVYWDKSSNLCIAKPILKRFNELTPDAVYERAQKFWRKRLKTDQPGRLQ